MDRTERPASHEYNPYYSTYLRLVPDGDILQTLSQQHERTQALLHGLSDAQASWRPAAGEWSVKQVIGHLLDTERVFAFRALWFARDGGVELPGFDQDAWMLNCDFDARTLPDLMAEWGRCRASNLDLFTSFDQQAWLGSGIASGGPCTVRMWIWAIAGHELHHVESLQTVYRTALSRPDA